MSAEGKKQPTREEMERAEHMMTAGPEKGHNLDLSLSEEMKTFIKQKISEFAAEKLWEIREVMTSYSLDPTRSNVYNARQQKLKPTPQWAIFIGESVEDELTKRGLVRRGL